MKELTKDQVEFVSGGFMGRLVFLAYGYVTLITALTAGIGSAAIIWSNQE